MSNEVGIFFKYQGRMYSIMFNTSVREITLSMVEARILKKISLDEGRVKLELSYFPVLMGRDEEKLVIEDEEDMSVYLRCGGKENRRCLLYVEVIASSEQPEQLSRVEKSSTGMNFDVLEHYTIHDDGEEQAKEQHQAMEDDDDDDRSRDECMDNGMEISDMRERYIEPQPVVEPCQFIEEWEDGLGLSVGQEFKNRKAVQEVVDRGAFAKSFGYRIIKSDKVRLVLKCPIENCKWALRAAVVTNTEIFSIRTYTKMHTCSRASQSTSNTKRKGSAQLVASYLNEKYPGQMDTPKPKIIMGMVQRDLGVQICYSTALRGKSLAVRDLRGSPEDNYKLLYRYLYVLEQFNPGTKTKLLLDDVGKFKYLFIALGASIEGFQAMRKVIIVDATFIKNGFGGVLVFASAQDPNRHHYPIAFGVLDGEKLDSWTWFFEMLKSVVPDSSELVFMSDRNANLISAIEKLYPLAHHGYCVWHLSQNVKTHTSGANKDVIAWRFMECSRIYTVGEFDRAYESFKMRYPTAAKYLEESTVKEKWARPYFPGCRYNLDTSNAVESLNSTFLDERKYPIIPMLDTIMRTFSQWFNEHRKEAAGGTAHNKLVPLVENFVHDTWPIAEKLIVSELNSFALEYDVTGSDGNSYLVNLRSRSCSCRYFDVQKYPCEHGIAAFIAFKKKAPQNREIGGHDIQLELHELCSRYYWTELWALAYCRTIYLVPDMSEWIIPDHINELQIIPPDRVKKKGRRKTKRFPSVGERRPRTKNKRRRRQGLQWLLFGFGSPV